MFARGAHARYSRRCFIGPSSPPVEPGPLNEQHCGEPVSSSTSVAVSTTHQAADFGAQRIVPPRILDRNILRLGLLALCEAAAVAVALYAAIFIRFAGS